MYVVEYDGINWHSYYSGSNNYYGRISRSFYTLEDAVSFAKQNYQDDDGLGAGKNNIRIVNTPKENVRIYKQVL